MKKDYSFEEKIAVEEALKALYVYNNALRFPVEESYIDTNVLADYFLSDDTQFCADCEKRIGMAAIRYCYDNPDILNKRRNAQLMCTQMQEAMRGAKIEAEYNSGKYGIGGKAGKAEMIREKKKRENSIVQKSIFLDKAKKTLINMPINMAKGVVKRSITPVIITSLASHGAFGAAIAGGSVTLFGVTVGAPLLVGAAVGAGMSLAYEAVKRLTPKPIKEKIKSMAHTAMEKTANVIENNVRKFQSTPVGQKVTTFIQEKVAPIVSKGAECLRSTYDKAKSAASSLWTKFKSFL